MLTKKTKICRAFFFANSILTGQNLVVYQLSSFFYSKRVECTLKGELTLRGEGYSGSNLSLLIWKTNFTFKNVKIHLAIFALDLSPQFKQPGPSSQLVLSPPLLELGPVLV